MLTVKKNSPVPIFKQITTQIIEALKKGELKPGDRLLPIRSIARELSINPATVAKAYTELEKQGVLVAGGRMGTYIAENFNIVEHSENSDSWQAEYENILKKCVQNGATKEQLLLELNNFFEK